MTPRVSAVIVRWSASPPLGPCLDALERCRARMPLEAIVVDQSSGDGALDPLRDRFPWIEVVEAADRRGFTFGINRGFARARGENVLMLSADCRISPEALERLLRALQCEPGLAAAAPALPDRLGLPARSCGRFPDLWTLLFDQLGLARAFPDSPVFGRYRYGGRWLETLEYVDWASGAALLVPRALWLELGGLDEGMFLSLEEVDWCRRAARAGHRVRFVPAARVVQASRTAAREVPEEAHLHHLRSCVHYFRKHHGATVAVVARAILSAGLLMRWAAASVPRPGEARGSRPGRSARARLCATGLGVVWAA
ncbi:MAG TPA: glycosyltransferase [Candidatus Eisenbacteria bacterium]